MPGSLQEIVSNSDFCLLLDRELLEIKIIDALMQ